jgi:hypothetical protein
MTAASELLHSRRMQLDTNPAQRAAVLKLTLATVADHPRSDEIRAAIPTELRSTIELARPSEWLAITHSMALLEVIWSVLAREEFLDFYLQQIERAQVDSMFGRFMSTAGRLFVRTPLGRLRNLSRGFDLAQRDAGELEVTAQGENAARVRLHSLPIALRNVCYATSMQAPLHFAVALESNEVRIDMDLRELANGVVHYSVRWTNPTLG